MTDDEMMAFRRQRNWETRARTVELRIPKLREGSYFLVFLEPRRLAEKAPTGCSRKACIQGVSTRPREVLGLAVGPSEAEPFWTVKCERLLHSPVLGSDRRDFVRNMEHNGGTAACGRSATVDGRCNEHSAEQRLWASASSKLRHIAWSAGFLGGVRMLQSYRNLLTND